MGYAILVNVFLLLMVYVASIAALAYLYEDIE